MLTKEELQTLSNLLFTGKWGLSMQENQQIINPLINKLAQEIDLLTKQQEEKQPKDDAKKPKHS